MGGLLERVGEADQLGLAECGPGKRRAKGRRQRAEARWHGRRIGEEAGRHDHARVPRARRRVGAEVRWEKGGVELLARGAYRNGNDVGALRRNHSGVEHVEAARPCELQVQRTIRKVVVEVLSGTGVEHVGGLRDGLAILEGDRKSTRLNSSHVSISYAV